MSNLFVNPSGDLQLNRNRYCSTLVLCGILLGASFAISAKDKNAYEGQFWSTGKHFQISGETVAIAEDGIHDPTNITALFGLQPPEEAMRNFPRDSAGLIDWVQTLDKGHIAPRSDLHGVGENLQPIELDIIFTAISAMNPVLFQHKQHTAWLACENCHPAIFVKKKGANKFTMADILNGKYCGVCHGKVAFAPTKNCIRCHSVNKKKN